MNGQAPVLPEVFADAILDLHVEGGVFRLTLAFAMPQPPGTPPPAGGEGHPVTLVPKAVLLLTEPAFQSLCEVVDGVRQQLSEAGAAAGGSPNFGH